MTTDDVDDVMALCVLRTICRDDPFYVDRYRALFWAQEGGKRYPEPAIDRPLTEDGELPFGGARLIRTPGF